MMGFIKPLRPLQIVEFSLAILVTSVVLESVAIAETNTTSTHVARGLVQQALQCEAAGKIDERNRLLQEAVTKAPDLASAQWARGMIRDGQRGWVAAENSPNPDCSNA